MTADPSTGFDPFAPSGIRPATAAESAAPAVAVIIGQSNAYHGDSSTADPVYGSAAVGAGVTYYENGTLTATWGNSPGLAPHLAARMLEAQVAAGVPVPACTVLVHAGGGESAPTTRSVRYPAAITKLRALGLTPDLWVYWQGEAETQDGTQASSPAESHRDKVGRMCHMMWSEYPNSRVYLMNLLMASNDYGGAGNSTHWPVVAAGFPIIAAAHPGRAKVVETRLPSVLTMADVVHAHPVGGFDVASQRIAALFGL